MHPQPQAIELEQCVEAPLDAVWKACSTCEGLASWQADQVDGELLEGGTVVLQWTAFGAQVELEVMERREKERLVLRHGATVVELRFEAGKVLLRQHHLNEGDDVEGLRSSWQIALAHLAQSVDRHPGRRRRTQWLVRHVRCSPESTYLYFSQDVLLRQWLAESGHFDETEGRYELELRGGHQLAGKILAHVPGRDVALASEGHGEAILALRTYPSPRSTEHRHVALSWSEWGPPCSPHLLTELSCSLDRLEQLLGRGALLA